MSDKKEQVPSEKLENSNNKELSQLSSNSNSLKTYKLEKSNIFERLNNFLPNLNNTDNLPNMEELNSDDEEYIEMNLGLGVFDVNPSQEENKLNDNQELIPNTQRKNSPSIIEDLKLSKETEEEESTTLWDFIQDPRGEKAKAGDDIILPRSVDSDSISTSETDSNNKINNPIEITHHPGIKVLSDIDSSNNSDNSKLGEEYGMKDD